MEVIYCPSCLTELNKYEKTCPECGKVLLFASTSEENYQKLISNTSAAERENTHSSKSEKNPMNLKKIALSHSASVAISSAKLDNAYGTYIQIVGIVIGIGFGIGGSWLTSQTGSPAYAVGGNLISALDIASFAVLGALYRMISNYVIARLSE